MKNQETISSGQMAILFFIFLNGSAIVNIPSPLINMAKNGAWLSLLIATGIGMVLLGCVLYLHRQYPELTFVDCSRKILGNWLTALLFIPVCSLILHMASGIVLDMGLFLTTTMMPQTPLYIFHVLIFLTCALTVRAGIETIARMFTLLVSMMLLFIIAVVLLPIPNYKPEYLLPVMPEGFKPILYGVYFAFGFPYGEIFLFAMLLPFVRSEQGNKLNKYMFYALIINCISLVTVTVTAIMLFGPMAMFRHYTEYEVARTIDVMEIVQRIESVIGISLVMGSFMKGTIVLFILNLVVSQLFKIEDNRILVFPLAFCCFLLSLVLIDSKAEWDRMVSTVHPLHVAVAYVFPLLLVTFVTFFKAKFRKEKSI